MNHCCSDGVIEYDHGIVGHMFHEVVERENLGPIRLFDAGCLIMNGDDGGLRRTSTNG